MDPIHSSHVRFGRHFRLAPWGAAACLVVAGVALSPGAAHAAPAKATAHSAAATGHYGSVSNLSGGAPMAVSSVITAGSCKYQQVSDDVHFSSTGFAMSSHGWWTKYSGT